jgi:hypothetical protein
MRGFRRPVGPIGVSLLRYCCYCLALLAVWQNGQVQAQQIEGLRVVAIAEQCGLPEAAVTLLGEKHYLAIPVR